MKKLTIIAAALASVSGLAQAETHGMMGVTLITPSDGERAFGGYITAIADDRTANFYLDGYYSGPSSDDEDHYDTLSEFTFGDPITSRKMYYSAVHLGVNLKISDHWTAYLAGGVVNKQEIISLYDPMHILARDGNYTVEGESQTDPSGSLGVIYSYKRVNLKAGYITGASAASFGIGYTF